MRATFSTLSAILLFFTISFGIISCQDHPMSPGSPESTTVVSGLKSPIGMTVGSNGWIWVTEAGTGNQDGQVSVIKDGVKYPVITGFSSRTTPESPGAEGISHLVIRGGKLYILHGIEGKLYFFDTAPFVPGSSTPLSATALASQDIGSYVVAHDLGAEDTGESNAYNLTFGPNGDLYITDAAANIIVRRKDETGELSVFSIFPNIANPTPMGPPKVNVVPTGIVFDGTNFWVSTLTGFPFATGNARIYKVDVAGMPSEYSKGYTALTDIVLTADQQPLVVQYAQFALPDGFQKETGQVVNGAGQSVVGGLAFPTDIERIDAKTYYILSYGLGAIQKVSY